MVYKLDNTLRAGVFDWDCDRVIYHLRDLQRYPLPGGPALQVCTTNPERGLLDIKLTKDSSLLCHAIRSPFFWWILKKTIFFSGLKVLIQKIRETRKFKSIHKWHFIEQKNEGRKSDNNSNLRRIDFMPRNLDYKFSSRIQSLPALL